MFIRAYLRASTKEQCAKCAKNHGHKIAAIYVENESGATLIRTQLMQLNSIYQVSYGWDTTESPTIPGRFTTLSLDKP
ncbi:hypothetical protein RCH20_002410 [Psychrobacter sp. PL15]|uniref:hypothetical protein n=1 Tax=Psychrobacter sp. PL15 TaxID=3071719 RepID=UPI002DF9F54F|nr:hypothetical protein [Psychrobacter sp. PL15]